VKKDVRKFSRISFVSAVRLSWEDSGVQKYTNGKCIDICEDGLHIEVLETISVGARMMLSVERLKFTGPGTVKHVARRGAKYSVRIEMSQPLAAEILLAIREGTLT
jgi:hypothetical protein